MGTWTAIQLNKYLSLHVSLCTCTPPSILLRSASHSIIRHCLAQHACGSFNEFHRQLCRTIDVEIMLFSNKRYATRAPKFFHSISNEKRILFRFLFMSDGKFIFTVRCDKANKFRVHAHARYSSIVFHLSCFPNKFPLHTNVGPENHTSSDDFDSSNRSGQNAHSHRCQRMTALV